MHPIFSHLVNFFKENNYNNLKYATNNEALIHYLAREY
jgi:hypothetical protein